MAYPLATSGSIYPSGSSQPNPAYSERFIPTVWSSVLVDKFYDTTVLAAISNTNYEGEIRNFGDKVIIRTRPSLTIRRYRINQTLEVERPSSDTLILNIDQGGYFNAGCDDIHVIQSDLDMLSLWAEDAAEQVKLFVDRDVLHYVIGNIAASNRGTTAGIRSGAFNLGAPGSPRAITSANIVELLVDLGTVLDEANIPGTGRWLIIPPLVANRIKKSELRDASLAGDETSLLRNGRIGIIDRFTIYVSNHLPTSATDWQFDSNGDPVLDANGDPVLNTANNADNALYMLAGHSAGLTFAAQVNKIETLRSERSFQTLLRGLTVYGRKVVMPTALATAYVTVS